MRDSKFYECVYYVKANNDLLDGHFRPSYEEEQSYTRSGKMFTEEEVKAEFTIENLRKWGKDVTRLGCIRVFEVTKEITL
jgi:hypothetical protein